MLRALVWRWIRWFLFRFDAETVHRATVRMVSLGSQIGGGRLLRVVSGAPTAKESEQSGATVVFGLRFNSCVGLAAGFDKDAEIVTALPHLGFGFAEIGTVTPRPQPGNSLPRLFREPQKQAVFNRMGFNGLGATVVSDRLKKAKTRLPDDFRIGVNIGKNKDTPLDQAATDYALAAARFEGLADYLVVNVSSPNTPGLRSLQTLDALKPILGAVNEIISRWRQRPPLLLKLAPEVEGTALSGILQAESELGIDGWVLTNTLSGKYHEKFEGGWSGAPLTELARERLREARAQTRLPIISVGGILSSEEAVLRVQAGADLIQLYSGWIFNGPAFPAEVSRALWRTNKQVRHSETGGSSVVANQ